jgi:hypothetical protein
MIVSDRYQFIFVHIPKCAGTSLRRVLTPYDDSCGAFSERVAEHPKFGRLDYTHLPLHVLAEVAPEQFEKLRSYGSYAISRDPFQRFPSAIAQRLKMYVRQELAQVDRAALHAEIDSAITFLRGQTHVVAPDYIHFARQVDFVRLRGEVFVKEVFPVERLDAFMDTVGARVGTHLGEVGHENQAGVLRFNNLRGLVVFGSNAAKRLLPASTSRALRDRARRLLLKPAHQNLPPAFASKTVVDFVNDYYADDITLHRNSVLRLQAQNQPERQSATA